MLCHMATFAEYERGRVQKRVQAGVDSAKAHGVKFGRPTPDGKEGRLEPPDGPASHRAPASELSTLRSLSGRRSPTTGGWFCVFRRTS